tara:strand:+ start:495 stop:1130 length:636 start_codon:yes stop_codon:yes gene_type:complete
MELTTLKPFGPSILKAKIPEKIVKNINNYIDELIFDKKKSTTSDYGQNLAGDVTQEFLLDPQFIKQVGWLDFLGKCTFAWIKKELNQEIKKFNVTSSWVVRQYQHEYNPVHWHSGHISGAGFLKVPENLGNFSQQEQKKGKEYTGGNLNLIHGSRMFLSESLISIKPEVGDFYFFPNYLMHTVYPFKDTKEERRSISFNATIDPNIHDIYI